MRQARPQRRKRRQMAEINVVPYIDVMLVLLVIFMITAPLLRTGVDIDLPDAASTPIDSEAAAADPMILTVDKDGLWYLSVSDEPESQTERAEVQRLATAYLRVNPETRVLVAGDKSVQYGDIMQAMAALQSAGAPTVGLLSQPPQ